MPASQLRDNPEELAFVLATDAALWRLLEVTVDEECSAHVDRHLGHPFTLPRGSLGPEDVIRLDHQTVTAEGAVVMLRRMAARWGGSYDPRSGRLSGCCLGLVPSVWSSFSR